VVTLVKPSGRNQKNPNWNNMNLGLAERQVKIEQRLEEIQNEKLHFSQYGFAFNR
jgi:hypothetical protein